MTNHKNIIVTGGAGFIASHIVDAYLAKGHSVAVVDNLSKGFKKNLNPKAKFYKADITDLSAMRRIFKKERPDIVNHHAAIAVVTESMRDPLPTYGTNLMGTVNVLIAAGEQGVKKVLFASTGGAMYGDPVALPVDEHVSPAPLSPYGLSKLLGEEAVAFYAGMFGFDHLIFRYANVYGPRQNPKGEAGIVAIFSELMRNSQVPTIFGDGTKTRDYVYVGDVVKANVLGLNKGHGTILNIGRSVEVTDQQVFDAIANELRFKGDPRYAPFRPGEINRIALNATKAGEVLGWKPSVSFALGIKRSV